MSLRPSRFMIIKRLESTCIVVDSHKFLDLDAQRKVNHRSVTLVSRCFQNEGFPSQNCST